MKIEKKSVRTSLLKVEKNVQVTIDEDLNVPDSKPDVERIVESRGEVHIDETEVLKDRIRIRGTFCVQILYLSTEKEKQVACMEHEFPIEEMMNVEGAEPADFAKVFVDLEDLTVSIINSRKCGVRSVLFVHIGIAQMKLVECTIGIEKQETVQCLYQPAGLSEIVINKKDISRIKADISLPAGKPNMAEILWHCLQLRDVDVRMMDDKMNVRGELFLFVFYRSEDSQDPVQYYDWEIPFSSELECDGSEEDLIGNISVAMGNRQVSIKADEDGEPRNVEVEAVLELDLKAYRELQMPVLGDLYANDRKLKLRTKPIEVETLLFQNNAKTKVTERISIAKGASSLLQILNVEGTIRIEDFSYVEQGILVEGLIFCKVLYMVVEDNAPIQSRDLVIPFEYTVEAQNVTPEIRCEIRGVLEQVGAYMVDGNEVEIRAVAGIYVTGFEKKTVSMIEAVEEEAYGEEEWSKIPSITGYIVKSGDTLWKIAKKYGTTMEKIAVYNEGVEEPLLVGQKLFLLKEMESLMG